MNSKFHLFHPPTLLALALFAVSAYAPVHAQQACALSDGDPNTETDGGSTAPGDDSVSCGRLNVAGGQRSTSIGSFNSAAGFSSIAIGTSSEATVDSAMAIGNQAHANGIASTAIGNDTHANGMASTAIGLSVNATGNASVAIGGGFDVNGNGTFVEADVDIDNDGNPDMSSELTTAFGENSVAIGPGAWAFGNGSAAFGAGSFAAGDNSIAIGKGSRADEANVVSVGSVGNERRIVNVAQAIQGTDAVNLTQLQDGLAKANAYTDTAVATGGTQANAYTDNREAAVRQDMQAGDAQTLSAANDYTDKKFANLDFSGINDRFDAIDRRVGHLDDRLNRVGALGAAMVGMASSAAAVEGGRTRIGIAAGAYGGKQALSVGLQQRINSRAALTIGGAFSGSERSATIGVGFGL